MTQDVAQDQDVLTRTRDYAKLRGVGRIGWGCIIRTGYDDEGHIRFLATTLAGERVYLTHALLDDLGMVVLQGEMFACLSALDAGEPSEPVGDIKIASWLGAPGEGTGMRLSLTSEYQLGRSQPLICLCEEKPQGWPA
jgi:hypothetical protein